VRATQQDGTYPRPTMCRERWTSLDGPWDFAHDDDDRGLHERWYAPRDGEGDGGGGPFDRTIEVPFPPESPASGIADPGFHPVVWYRRRVGHEELVGSGDDSGHGRVLVHFGAVDHRARVWCDGHLVAEHVGGQTPFTADVTDVLESASGDHVLVVRAEDDPTELSQPRGKQDWRERPHGIWYERTTGIWQTVWCETVPAEHVVDVAWSTHVPSGVVHGEITLARTPSTPLSIEVTLTLGDEVLAEASVVARGAVTTFDVPVPALRNGQDRARLLWSVESPRLVDAGVVLRDRASGQVVDEVASYLGLRTVSVGGRSFAMNGQPYYLRSVLNQGYRPETHLATRGTEELRGEVELIKAMGFNAVRVHQKAEDPRFLFWADRLGLMVWAETAGAYEFSTRAVSMLTTEWLAMVRRDRSHPSIVCWVPLNESWGVQDISTDPSQQAYARSLADLTRALDPTRPVMSNEGWEHVDSDILGLHDYTVDPDHLRARWATRQSTQESVLAVHGPQGRRAILSDAQREAFLAGRTPLMVSEFGGISLSEAAQTWGYGNVSSVSDYATVLTGLFEALRASTEVVGFCYTQFMDTSLETNGLVYADGTPKLSPLDIRVIVTGSKDLDQEPPTSTFGWTG
jgi:beta-galactosidase/beta-glucuronidase